MKSIINFLTEVVTELKKVTWPTRAEATRMTVVVIITTIIVGAYIGTIDFGLTKFLEQFLR